MVKRGKERKQQLHFLKKKLRQLSNVSKQQDKGWIHVIRVHDTTHLAVTTARQGNRRSRTTPHKERMSGLVKHRHSYIVNERHRKWTIYLEKQKGKPREKN